MVPVARCSPPSSPKRSQPPGSASSWSNPYSPSSMLARAKGQMRLDPPARLARQAAFASRCGAVMHEAMAAHCEIAADFAAGLGFGPHVQHAVRFEYERYDGRSQAFHRRAAEIPLPAQVLHVAQAADAVRGLVGAEEAASMVRRRAGSYFHPGVAGAYLHLAGGLWPRGDNPVPLAAVFSADPGTPVDELPGDRRLAVCEVLADFADLKSARRYPHSHKVANVSVLVAAELGLEEADQDRLRRAGPVHDAGKIAVPAHLLEEARDDTDGHCCVAPSLNRVEHDRDASLGSDGRHEIVERDAQPVAARSFGSDFIVATAEILHEGMTGGESPR